jgi:hypothetical protein
MSASGGKIEGFVLVLVVLISAYLTVVQIVNGLGFDGLIKTFSVMDSRNSGLEVDLVWLKVTSH